MPAVPDPMTPLPHSRTLTHLLRGTFTTPNLLSTRLFCALVSGLLLPAALLAGEATDAGAPTAEVAVLQPSDAEASAEIRLKFHSVEHLGIHPRKSHMGIQPVEPLTGHADELKKQALTRHLASKFKQREAALRKFVDLVWEEAGKREQLEPELLIAIIQKESAFRPTVQSRYGAQGLMQVVPRWHRDKMKPSESLFDPQVNIRVGADVLEEYLALADGDLDLALRKYSGNARGYVNTIKKEARKLARIAEQAARHAQIAQG